MSNLKTVYEQDFHLWLCHNVQLLRERKISEIDIENIAEELDAMGKTQHRELVSRLKILFARLLKWQFEPEHRSGSWKRTIVEQRHQIEQLLEMSPSLNHQIDQKIPKAYKKAVEYAAAETGISESVFPRNCPYPLEDALNKDFYPESKLET
ncbi:DUF29 domain-containing protein [Desulfonema magnum]|uniref:DUF29 n=1 Tax=Desulfonema magnum TaxID=45655 RepID=A0A975BPX6_9BACT|nr:DUF29 domain-containing protein [Desulfonema magnum]QTA89542.1 DUF29 [Desulfonema magnum]